MLSSVTILFGEEREILKMRLEVVLEFNLISLRSKEYTYKSGNESKEQQRQEMQLLSLVILLLEKPKPSMVLSVTLRPGKLVPPSGY